MRLLSDFNFDGIKVIIAVLKLLLCTLTVTGVFYATAEK